jgi:hypothetical protein
MVIVVIIGTNGRVFVEIDLSIFVCITTEIMSLTPVIQEINQDKIKYLIFRTANRNWIKLKIISQCVQCFQEN